MEQQINLQEVRFIINDPFMVLEHARELAHMADDDDSEESAIFRSIAMMLDYTMVTQVQLPEVLALCVRVTRELVLPNLKPHFTHGLSDIPCDKISPAVSQTFLYVQSTAFLHVMCHMAIMSMNASGGAKMIGVGSPEQYDVVKERTAKMIASGEIPATAWSQVMDEFKEHPERIDQALLDTLVVELAMPERSV